jgi:hypothetical protein
MPGWIHTLKPAASRRTHLLAAAALWTTVGAGLLFFGIRWILTAPGWLPALLTVSAIGLGCLKFRFVLRKSAARIVNRIRARGEDRCLGGFLSPATWLLVLAMIAAGRLIQAHSIPLIAVGFLYAGVGTALLLASLSLWRAYRSARTDR